MMEVRRSDLILSLIMNLDLGTIEVSNLARNLRHLDITLFCTCNHLFFSFVIFSALMEFLDNMFIKSLVVVTVTWKFPEKTTIRQNVTIFLEKYTSLSSL